MLLARALSRTWRQRPPPGRQAQRSVGIVVAHYRLTSSSFSWRQLSSPSAGPGMHEAGKAQRREFLSFRKRPHNATLRWCRNCSYRDVTLTLGEGRHLYRYISTQLHIPLLFGRLDSARPQPAAAARGVIPAQPQVRF